MCILFWSLFFKLLSKLAENCTEFSLLVGCWPFTINYLTGISRKHRLKQKKKSPRLLLSLFYSFISEKFIPRLWLHSLDNWSCTHMVAQQKNKGVRGKEIDKIQATYLCCWQTFIAIITTNTWIWVLFVWVDVINARCEQKKKSIEDCHSMHG